MNKMNEKSLILKRYLYGKVNAIIKIHMRFITGFTFSELYSFSHGKSIHDCHEPFEELCCHGDEEEFHDWCG